MHLFVKATMPCTLFSNKKLKKYFISDTLQVKAYLYLVLLDHSCSWTSLKYLVQSLYKT